MSTQNRIGKGVSEGGRFAAHARDDAALTLGAPASAAPTMQTALRSSDRGVLTAIVDSGRDDLIVGVARNPRTPGPLLTRIAQSSESAAVRSFVAENPSTPPVTLYALADASEPVAAYWARRNPAYQPRTLREKASIGLERFIAGAA